MTTSLKATLLEIAKWLIVLWLMSPLALAMRGPVDFSRVALGILLFIIFTGKLLFDSIVAPLKTRSERSAAQDVIMMIGVVAVIGLAVAMMVLLIGLYVMKLMASQNQTPGQ
jgi:hypothetical protein